MQTPRHSFGLALQLGLEVFDPLDEFVQSQRAVVVSDFLAEPLPKMLDGHQVGAVAGQSDELETEYVGLLRIL